MADNIYSQRYDVEEANPQDTGKSALELHDIKDKQQHHDMRGAFAEIAYGIMQSWVGFLIAITLIQIMVKRWGYGLQTPEYIAIVTTTTASVFGFGFIVGNYLFPKSGRAPHDK